jgi:hypothetical protein
LPDDVQKVSEAAALKDLISRRRPVGDTASCQPALHGTFLQRLGLRFPKSLAKGSGDGNGLKRGNGLDHDQFGQLLADGEAGVANLADEIVTAGDEADDPVFPEADFAQAVLNFGRGAKLADAHRDARLDAAQRTNFTIGFRSDRCLIDVHGQELPARRLRRLTAFWQWMGIFCGESVTLGTASATVLRAGGEQRAWDLDNFADCQSRYSTGCQPIVFGMENAEG